MPKPRVCALRRLHCGDSAYVRSFYMPVQYAACSVQRSGIAVIPSGLAQRSISPYRQETSFGFRCPNKFTHCSLTGKRKFQTTICFDRRREMQKRTLAQQPTRNGASPRALAGHYEMFCAIYLSIFTDTSTVVLYQQRSSRHPEVVKVARRIRSACVASGSARTEQYWMFDGRRPRIVPS